MTRITLMDGSGSQEPVRRRGDKATPQWSTQVMMDRPELVGQVHVDYFVVGATIATANTCALQRPRAIWRAHRRFPGAAAGLLPA